MFFLVNLDYFEARTVRMPVEQHPFAVHRPIGFLLGSEHQCFDIVE